MAEGMKGCPDCGQDFRSAERRAENDAFNAPPPQQRDPHAGMSADLHALTHAVTAQVREQEAHEVERDGKVGSLVHDSLFGRGDQREQRERHERDDERRDEVIRLRNRAHVERDEAARLRGEPVAPHGPQVSVRAESSDLDPANWLIAAGVVGAVLAFGIFLKAEAATAGVKVILAAGGACIVAGAVWKAARKPAAPPK
jgi:predicted  nucleic acid-binding Zn-ribbon protein